MNENIKFFEVRDSATMMPFMAIRIDSHFTVPENLLLAHAGYGSGETRDSMNYTYLVDLNIGEGQIDPFKWNDRMVRTRRVAHNYIREHWDELKSCDVVDVEYILGETKEKKSPELTMPFAMPF